MQETLVQHLRSMGGNFCASAERFDGTDGGRTDEHVFQNLHWGLELLLKAYLHHRGWTDARCIADVRHDLGKALAACEREGLEGIDPEIRALRRVILAFLGMPRRSAPRSQRMRFHRST
ncbi:hypothetical protein [Blastomonas sp. UPD001]|uniref:hypothetical protein n=1 Tax=Blastomonas sp. UPD001 TaxID=2217673 RepID=UPI001E46EAE9|nr:hypothetical protein [Blastomonas sp. UPD001]